MALNISVFPSAGMQAHAHNGINAVGALGVASVLAASTSASVEGPCQLVLTPDEGQRLAIVKQTDDPAADPSASGHKLVANVSRHFELGPGTWWLRWIAG